MGRPQGVKMPTMNVMPTPIERKKGQIVGPGETWRWSGSASSMPVIRNSRRSLRRPVTTGWAGRRGATGGGPPATARGGEGEGGARADHRQVLEVVGRRRRGGRPFEGVRSPRVVPGRRAAAQAYPAVEHE